MYGLEGFDQEQDGPWLFTFRYKVLLPWRFPHNPQSEGNHPFFHKRDGLRH